MGDFKGNLKVVYYCLDKIFDMAYIDFLMNNNREYNLNCWWWPVGESDR